MSTDSAQHWLPYPIAGQVWAADEWRARVVEVLRDPHPVQFRAGGCFYVSQVGSVMMEAVEGGRRYEVFEWPPHGTLVEGPGAEWDSDHETPRALIHHLPAEATQREGALFYRPDEVEKPPPRRPSASQG